MQDAKQISLIISSSEVAATKLEQIIPRVGVCHALAVHFEDCLVGPVASAAIKNSLINLLSFENSEHSQSYRHLKQNESGPQRISSTSPVYPVSFRVWTSTEAVLSQASLSTNSIGSTTSYMQLAFAGLQLISSLKINPITPVRLPVRRTANVQLAPCL